MKFKLPPIDGMLLSRFQAGMSEWGCSGVRIFQVLVCGVQVFKYLRGAHISTYNILVCTNMHNCTFSLDLEYIECVCIVHGYFVVDLLLKILLKL